MTPDDLTPATRRVWEALHAYTAEHGYPPSVRDLAAATGTASNSTVVWHLDRLEAAGLIRRAPGVPRGIVITDPTDGSAQ